MKNIHVLKSKQISVGEYGYITANPWTYMNNIDIRNQMKASLTIAEKILWDKIRNKQLGFKFRKQHIIGDYIVDFVCLIKNLIIEVDGKIHELRKQYDNERTKELSKLGFKVIRFTNEQIYKDIQSVIREILLNLK